MTDWWTALWRRLLSPTTARFVLAMLALLFSAGGAFLLVTPSEYEPGQAAIFAVGQLFALATMAFGYYFGSTARGDERRAAPPEGETQP
jgi:hypothetical protein